MDSENISEFLEDDIFSILDALETASDYNNPQESFEFQKSAYSPLNAFQESETEVEAASPKCKKQKLNSAAASASHEEGQQKVSHITVERNRRKQMNENLSVLRSLMPCFYVKRGDQASIIGGVVNYINELQQVLQSLEAKKQRKAAYTEIILSPRLSSPRPSLSPLSPRKPPLSPRLSLPISPSTPQPSSPYKPMMHNLQTGFLNSPSLSSPVDLSPCNSSTNSSINDCVNELVACSKSAVAEVEVKFSGPNLVLKTVSHRIPGQAVKIVSALEELALEILQVNINTVDERMLNSFTIKIGIECQLSAEELAQQIQQTFC
ncbi:Transcriptional repressors of the hairy/E(spl) family (contains HLH) [Handroanthus impetiginosus]|uniref:Transcriptional repressors of the hairy/E(Spl) family (Contains HLH) n=1 Tax=Handroanthus impetiginosus TaxID=429701 RepID=A0A2G9IBK2_9LAMI|nr:Transcriptional repressors of the hairy/E(spl) family (contains HLH) [Handroanthus impetiginosus]